MWVVIYCVRCDTVCGRLYVMCVVWAVIYSVGGDMLYGL